MYKLIFLISIMFILFVPIANAKEVNKFTHNFKVFAEARQQPSHLQNILNYHPIWENTTHTCIEEYMYARPHLQTIVNSKVVQDKLVSLMLLDLMQQETFYLQNNITTLKNNLTHLNIKNKKIKKINQSKLRFINFINSIPQIDYCNVYKSWGDQSFSLQQIPLIIPKNNYKILGKNYLKNINQGMKELKRLKVSYKQRVLIKISPWSKNVDIYKINTLSQKDIF